METQSPTQEKQRFSRRFFLVDRKNGKGPTWLLANNKSWFTVLDYVELDRSPSDVILETRTIETLAANSTYASAYFAKAPEQLDWSRTFLVRDGQSKDGWLDRNGRFYGCCKYGHINYARLILKTESYKLSEAGWTQVSSCMGDDGGYWQQNNLSPEQRQWLNSHGYNVPEGYL